MSFKIKHNSMAFPRVTVGYKESRWNFCQQKTGSWTGSTRRTTLLLESQERNAVKGNLKKFVVGVDFGGRKFLLFLCSTRKLISISTVSQ